MRSKLKHLIQIAEMKYLSDQRAYNKLSQRQGDLNEISARLDESRYIASTDAFDANTQQRSFQWGRWIDASQAKINAELFVLAGKDVAQRAQLEKSYGRYLAIRMVSKNK